MWCGLCPASEAVHGRHAFTLCQPVDAAPGTAAATGEPPVVPGRNGVSCLALTSDCTTHGEGDRPAISPAPGRAPSSSRGRKGGSTMGGSDAGAGGWGRTSGVARPRKKLLYLAVCDPDLEVTGATVRMGAFVKHLGRFYDVTLVNMAGSGYRVDPEVEERFRDRTNRLGVSHRVRVRFSQPGYFLFSPTLYRAASRLLQAEAFDYLLVDYGLAAVYGRLMARRFDIPMIYCSHNVEYRMYLDQSKSDFRRGVLAPYVFLAERAACRAATLVVAISESDGNEYLKWIGPERIEVIPQGVDADVCNPFYPPPPPPAPPPAGGAVRRQLPAGPQPRGRAADRPEDLPGGARGPAGRRLSAGRLRAPSPVERASRRVHRLRGRPGALPAAGQSGDRADAVRHRHVHQDRVRHGVREDGPDDPGRRRRDSPETPPDGGGTARRIRRPHRGAAGDASSGGCRGVPGGVRRFCVGEPHRAAAPADRVAQCIGSQPPGRLSRVPHWRDCHGNDSRRGGQGTPDGDAGPVRESRHPAFQGDCADGAARQRQPAVQHPLRDVQHLGAQVSPCAESGAVRYHLRGSRVREGGVHHSGRWRADAAARPAGNHRSDARPHAAAQEAADPVQRDQPRQCPGAVSAHCAVLRQAPDPPDPGGVPRRDR